MLSIQSDSIFGTFQYGVFKTWKLNFQLEKVLSVKQLGKHNFDTVILMQVLILFWKPNENEIFMQILFKILLVVLKNILNENVFSEYLEYYYLKWFTAWIGKNKGFEAKPKHHHTEAVAN